ncbi:hypothetical protein, partial [Aeromonas caviae]
VHREDRLSHPGRTDAVNPVLVNRYMEASVCVGGLAVCKKSTMEQGGHGQIMMNGEKTFLIKHVLVMMSHRRMPYGI